MTRDHKLRQYLLGAVVTLLMTVGSCAGKNILDRVSTLEANDADRKSDISAIKQNLSDFRESFEDFKKNDSDWKQNNGRGNGSRNR